MSQQHDYSISACQHYSSRIPVAYICIPAIYQHISMAAYCSISACWHFGMSAFQHVAQHVSMSTVSTPVLQHPSNLASQEVSRAKLECQASTDGAPYFQWLSHGNWSLARGWNISPMQCSVFVMMEHNASCTPGTGPERFINKGCMPWWLSTHASYTSHTVCFASIYRLIMHLLADVGGNVLVLQYCSIAVLHWWLA